MADHKNLNSNTPNPLAHLPILDRIKIVKQLLLDKLDALQLQQVNLTSQFEHQSKILIEDNSLLLKTAIDLVEAVHQTRHDIKYQYQDFQDAIFKKIQDNNNDWKLQFQFLVNQLQKYQDELQQQLYSTQENAHKNTQEQLQKYQDELQQQLYSTQENAYKNTQEQLQKHQDELQQQLYSTQENAYKNTQEQLQKYQDELYQNWQSLQQDNQQATQLLQKTLIKLQEEVQQIRQTSVNTVNTIGNKIFQIETSIGQISEYIPKFTRIKLSSADCLEPEIILMMHLYSFLPNRFAIDIGANIGTVSENLLKTGYEVFAFEPFPTVFDKINQRLGSNANFHCFPYAIGNTNDTMDLHIATDLSESNIYGDATLFSSLTPHSMPEDLVFTSTVPVTVTTLEDLHNRAKIPAEVSLVKIDTEGFDLEVIRGMGNYRYPVVVAEFWDNTKHPFGQKNAFNRISDLVDEMKTKNYYWYLVIYHIWDSPEISFYCNYSQSVEKSWGNIFFFQDHEIFTEAVKWCSATLPITYFVA